jgi:hypothetical protein
MEMSRMGITGNLHPIQGQDTPDTNPMVPLIIMTAGLCRWQSSALP